MPNPTHHQTNKSQFADDGGQWAVSKNIDLAAEYLQRDLDKLARWCAKVHVPDFEGVSGSEDKGGGDNSIQFINIVRVGDKSFKEWRQKIGGERMGDNNILTFLCY